VSAVAALDHALVQWAATWQAPWLDGLMLFASHVGRAGFVWLVVAGVAAVFPNRRPAAWRVVLAVGLTALLVDGVVKPLVWRDRPFAALTDVRVIDARPPTSSFPSGHTAVAVAGAIAVSQLLPGARVAWWLLAATIAISRVYVGVHFPSDVLAGAIVGLLCATLVLGRVSSRTPPAAT
jgi:undecaprenyl-diphosphatase